MALPVSLRGPTAIAMLVCSGLALALAGLAAALATTLILVTAGVLAGRGLRHRRRRRALTQVVDALRILNRELRAGADPATAAGNAAGAATGSGAFVLAELLVAIRAGHRDSHPRGARAGPAPVAVSPMVATGFGSWTWWRPAYPAVDDAVLQVQSRVISG